MRPLVVNADDFGLAPAVNEGILDAFHAGSLTSATLLVNAAATEEAVRLSRAHPGLGVGLHFNLTLGRPIAPAIQVQSLVDGNGHFHTRGELARRLLTHRVRAKHVEHELQAQFERMRALGVEPDHVDSHQHVHTFPLVFDVLAGFCASRRLPVRVPWLLGIPGSSASVGRAARQWLLQRMLRRNRSRWQGRVAWNQGLGSLFDLGSVPESPGLADYRRLLGAAPQSEGVFELMVHPARDARSVDGLTRIGAVSEAEWRVLSQRGLSTLAQEMGFRLTTYGEAFADTHGSG